MAAILFVRIKSGLDAEEFERRLAERRPRFREVPGLVAGCPDDRRDVLAPQVEGVDLGDHGRQSR
jgi:hypothetical protein